MFVAMNASALTPSQLAHVASVFPECRAQMAQYLGDGVEVDICVQKEVGEAPPYAIYICSDPEFWVDCCASMEQAQALATSLGLKLARS